MVTGSGGPIEPAYGAQQVSFGTVMYPGGMVVPVVTPQTSSPAPQEQGKCCAVRFLLEHLFWT